MLMRYHVAVSPEGPLDNETSESSEAHVLEFHVLQYDMTASDESLQPEVLDGHVPDLSLATSELALSRQRLLRLRQLSQELPLELAVQQLNYAELGPRLPCIPRLLPLLRLCLMAATAPQHFDLEPAAAKAAVTAIQAKTDVGG